MPCGFAIREGDYKLIREYGGYPDNWCYNSEEGYQCRWPENYSNSSNTDGWLLYNITNDPNEEFPEISKSH